MAQRRRTGHDEKAERHGSIKKAPVDLISKTMTQPTNNKKRPPPERPSNLANVEMQVPPVYKECIAAYAQFVFVRYFIPIDLFANMLRAAMGNEEEDEEVDDDRVFGNDEADVEDTDSADDDDDDPTEQSDTHLGQSFMDVKTVMLRVNQFATSANAFVTWMHQSELADKYPELKAMIEACSNTLKIEPMLTDDYVEMIIEHEAECKNVVYQLPMQSNMIPLMQLLSFWCNIPKLMAVTVHRFKQKFPKLDNLANPKTVTSQSYAIGVIEAELAGIVSKCMHTYSMLAYFFQFVP